MFLVSEEQFCLLGVVVAHFLKDFGDGFVEGGFIPGVFATGEEMLGAEEAREALNSSAEAIEDRKGAVNGFDGGSHFEDAAGVDAEHVNLGFEVFEGKGFQVGLLTEVEAWGVEAVLEGIVIAGRSTAFTRDIRRGIGHGASFRLIVGRVDDINIARMFYDVKEEKQGDKGLMISDF